MIRRSSLIALEVALGLLVAFAIGLGLMWWRLSQGPLELAFVRERVETELSAARSGRPVDIDSVVLAMSPQGNALELRAVGVSIKDESGRELSRSEQARIELGVLPLLIGRVSLVRAEFDGAEITITFKPDGSAEIALGPEGTPPDIVIPPSANAESLEQKVQRWLDGLEATFRPVGPGGALRALSLRNAALAIIDDNNGGRWTADAANLELAREGRNLALFAEAHLEGASGAAPASIRITTDTRFQTALVEFGATDVRPRALFSQAALGPFAGLDAPFTATVSLGLDREVGVNRFEGEATLGRGAADVAGARFELSGGSLRGRYDIESDELIIDQLALGGETTRVNGDVRVRDVSAILRAAPDQPAAFNVSFPSMRVDVPGTFAEPIDLSNVEAVGAIVTAERSIRLERLQARIADAALDASGRLYWAEAGADGQVWPGIELRGSVEGALDARTGINFWPVGLGEGARSYLQRTLLGGRVSDVTATLDIRPSDFAAPAFRNEAVDLRFNVVDGALRYISTMSPVTNARGSGVLRGNSFNLTVDEARLNDLVVTDGRIDVPRLRPPGAMLTISARAQGEAANLIGILLEEPISMGDRLPVTPASVSGAGQVHLQLQRPIQENSTWDDWRFSIDGQIRNFAGQMSSRRMALSNGQLSVRGDQRAVTVSGPVRAGGSNVNVNWTEQLRARANASSSYVISGDFDAEDLQRLGYSIARYADGRVGVTVSGEGRGFDVDQGEIELDLTRAAVTAPREFWVKPEGQPASVRFTIARQSDGGLAFNELDARSTGLAAQGRIRLTRNGDIAEVDVPRLTIDGRANARVTAQRASDGGLDVTVRGALFDAAPFMGSDNTAEADGGSSASAVPMRASVIVDRLKMRGGATLNDARVQLTTARGALATLNAQGFAPARRSFSLALGQGEVNFRSDDAGFAVRALTGAENVVGGTATAQGTWRPGPPNQARFSVRLRDFRVVRLPAMAQLISSIGSLTGMVDTLNGDGIGFSSLEAQLVYANDRITFTDGRMAGPALGLTGAGSYNIARDNLDVDGVVAPSPGLNLSVLGNVPVIGDLLVSRRGEGVFGMTYAINGAVASPRVSVNPVSALTPGILRRIFEPVQRGAEETEAAPETPPAVPNAQEGTQAPGANAIAQAETARTQAQ